MKYCSQETQPPQTRVVTSSSERNELASTRSTFLNYRRRNALGHQVGRYDVLNRLVNDSAETFAVFAALADATRRRHSATLRIRERARLIHRRQEGRNHLIRPKQSGLILARQWLVRTRSRVESQL